MSSTQASIGARLDRLPITRRHWLVFGVVGAGLVVDGVDLAIMSGINGALVADGASLEEVSWIATATAAGLGAGAFAGGWAGDLLGRRPVILLAAAVIALGALGAALAGGILELALWRGLTAFGLGVENVLAYGMLIEILPARFRGRWLARLAMLATTAAPLALLAGYYVLPAPDGWRQLLFGVCALSVLTFLLRFLLPESPRWLAARGRVGESEETVAVFERTAPAALEGEAADAPSATVDHPPALSAAMALRVAIAALINIAVVVATLGFVSWLPAFFASEGHDVPKALLMSLIMTGGAPIGAFLGMLASDRFERRWSSAVAALVAAGAGIAYALAPSEALAPMGLLTVISIYAFGAIALSGYMPELFPTPVRMRAIGLAISIGRVAAIGLPALIVFMFERAGQPGVMTMIVMVLLTLAIALALFGVSTRGRALEAG